MRVLVVLSGPVEQEEAEQRCAAALVDGNEVAVCFRMGAGIDLRASLSAQREVTAVLRRVLGQEAEKVPVFVATDSEGDRVEDYVLAWGATDVRR